MLRARTLHRDYLYPDFFFFFFFQLFLFSLFSLSPPVPHLSLVIHHLNLYTNSSPYLLLQLQLHTTQTRTVCEWEGLFLSLTRLPLLYPPLDLVVVLPSLASVDNSIHRIPSTPPTPSCLYPFPLLFPSFLSFPLRATTV